MKFFGVEGLTIAHGAGSTISGGSFTVTSLPSTKLLVSTKGIYKGNLSFSFSGGSAAGVTPGSITGSGTIAPTATKSIEGGLALIREGDTGTLTGTGVHPTTGAPVPVSGPVEITNAGQSKARGI